MQGWAPGCPSHTIPGRQHLGVQVWLWPVLAGLEELLQPRVEQQPHGFHVQAEAGSGQLQRIAFSQHIQALQFSREVLWWGVGVGEISLVCWSVSLIWGILGPLPEGSPTESPPGWH